MRPILAIVFIGFIAGSVLATIINLIPALDNLIPDKWEIFIIALFVGITANVLLLRRARKPDNNSSK